MESNPIVVDGVLYTSGTTGRVYALNAVTGEQLWYFNPESDGQVNRYTCCDEVNRGIAVWEGLVYVGSLDGRLFALDAKTGAVKWQQDTFIYKDRAYTSSGAPQIAGNVVVLGNAGADYDARGYVSAYDLKTGEFKWRFFTVPGDPKKGYEHPELELAAKTWDPNSRWDVGGGGTAWNTMTYDPELNLLYIGTGNAALFNWHERSPAGGDNLFLCSIIAINPDTGRMQWYYQQVPRESWDFTATQPFILADMDFNGQSHKVIMQAPKAGFFYILDRQSGKLLSANPYVPVNWATKIDLETGKATINPAVDYTNQKAVFVMPSGMGGHAWNPMAYNPANKLVYIPSIESGAISYDATVGHVYKPKQSNAGNVILFGDAMLTKPELLQEPVRSTLKAVQDSGQAKSRAALKAFDPATGKTVWEHENEGWWDRAGVLSTAGGLVFQGTDSGYLKAFNEKTGEEVLNLHVGTSIIAAPISYMVDGVQYIAVNAGWGGGGWFAPHDSSAVIKYGNQNRIIAFKLDGVAVTLPAEASKIGPLPEPPVANDAKPETIADGKKLFSASCAICHANVDYGMTPDLRRMSKEIHDGFKGIVLYGARRYKGMPQWDDVLNETQADAIHAYLTDLAWQAYNAQQNNSKVDTAPTNTTGH
ncbi:MAG TPA: PQQ-dependent dehydrogenase, methanol/ethanol family, partial [Candidatus Acidoferrum sp.]|nr:PQQ-dependent dehydrogenase, methanol/ethanol family [Candidatus Acidoferrum sp.]